MKRSLGKFDIFAIVLGAIIGWGSFMLPGTKFLKEAGVINTALGLILGAICIILIEKNYAVMINSQDEEGGEFSYTYNNMGKKHGFIVGWFLILAYLSMIPLNATAFPLVVKKLIGPVFEVGYLYTIAGYDVYLGEIILSTFIICLFAYVNIKGISGTSKIQNIIIMALISSVSIVFIGMVFKGDKTTFMNNYISNYKFDLGGIAKVFSITPFAFIGFDAIPQLSKEFKFSKKKASFVAIVSLLIGTLIYNLLNIITALAFSPSEAVTLDWAAGSAVIQVLGKWAFLLLIIALCAAVWSGINGFMICSSKLLGSIAKYGLVPSSIGNINNSGVFNNSIKFVTIVSLVAPWFGREVIIWIVDMSSLGAAIAYFYVSYISIKKVKTKGGKLIGCIGVAISILFMLLLLVPISPAALGIEPIVALIMWSCLGIIFYRVKIGKKNI
ncbi:APC family permease [Clostridium paraputrificum]|uniref:APC family permease n=1 Tax=Clostridium TaxID=1485 RepID=UPI000667BF27|nr:MULTISPECIES: APC family permease [Clostridium]MDB2075724.1 APC family permease [Clostridium paraputrificum]MDB2080223.1 APC family permease [Clostridium paraputrificum]MDB2085406.1 APC family permease [Clostridium paraputrificum]MDB2099739.1 APC family permease [Clostridium paraputrificum]MDB2107847.1 APC family permease [Clostridium paraputrificum]